jgi:hypothetical protein
MHKRQSFAPPFIWFEVEKFALTFDPVVQALPLNSLHQGDPSLANVIIHVQLAKPVHKLVNVPVPPLDE